MKIVQVSILVFAALIGLTACSKKTLQTKNNTTMSNKQQVVHLLKAIETGAQEPVGVINPNKYTQHNLGIADGLAGFGAALQQLPAGSARVNTVRVFQDGAYVVAHTDYNFFGPKIGFDIFRFEEGKIVEHWDNLQQTAGPNPSGHTMMEGPHRLPIQGKQKPTKPW